MGDPCDLGRYCRTCLALKIFVLWIWSNVTLIFGAEGILPQAYGNDRHEPEGLPETFASML